MEAIEDYSRAIELDGDFVAAYVNRGNVRQALKQHYLAIEDYDRGLNLDPSLGSGL